MEVYGKVYIIKNRINNKVYIGQTIQPIEYRFSQHIGQKKYTIGSAMKKYGVENFYVEFLCNAYNQSELDQLEIFYIEKFNSISPKGYNVKSGGAAGKLNEEAREKISRARKGKKPYEMTDEIRRNKSISKAKEGPQFKNKTSQYKGIGWDKEKNRWKASVENRDMGYWFFTHEDLKTCARIRDLYVYMNINKDSYLNFPDELLTINEAIDIMYERAHITNKPGKFLVQLLKDKGEIFKPRPKCNEHCMDNKKSDYYNIAWNSEHGKWECFVEIQGKRWTYSNKDELNCVKVRDFYITYKKLCNKKINIPDSIITEEECIQIMSDRYVLGRNLKKNKFLIELLGE